MNISLITSGAIIGSELSAEYGNLPPSFLPVGHKRLYELQIDTLINLAKDDPIFITLPSNFIVPKVDLDWFELNNINLIFVPGDIKLGNSIEIALNSINFRYDGLNILHGDTLIYDLKLNKLDVVAMIPQPEQYSWGELSENITKSDIKSKIKIKNEVLAGFFSFSNPNLFKECLIKSEGEFIEAIHIYNKNKVLTQFISKEWLDFGHLQTYYRSRCSIKTQREFNNVEINFREIVKSSKNHRKINAEAYWFDNIPYELRMYTPALLGLKSGSTPWYRLEYLPIPSLHELFVFGSLNENIWARIISSCFEFMEACTKFNDNSTLISKNNTIKDLILNKTLTRLSNSILSNSISLDNYWSYQGKSLPSLEKVAEITASVIDNSEKKYEGIMHGDLCFTNIFYDYRAIKIKVIDPRGSINNIEPSIMGDVRYDMAKLCHSALGGYDYILANRYKCNGLNETDLSIRFPNEGGKEMVKNIKNQFQIKGMKLTDIQIQGITVHLFLSMIPLHSDRPDRQNAFLANAMRIFVEEFY